MPPFVVVSTRLHLALSVLGRRARRASSRVSRRIIGDRSAGSARWLAFPDGGQTTAEYGLVILAAGSLALAAILWARNSGSITSLFETVIDQLTGAL